MHSGIDSEKWKKLLVEVSLTFSRAVEIAQSMESAAVRMKQLQSHMNTGGQYQRDVNNLAFTSNTCYRCGRVDHQSAHCPFKTAQCHNCGKQGHIQRVDSLRSRHSLPIREVEVEGTTFRQEVEVEVKVEVVQSGQYKKNLIIWMI